MMAPIVDVIIIGGGISGLSLLHFLKQTNIHCLLLEKNKTCGGLVMTEEVQGRRLEVGADAFLRNYENTTDLIHQLNLCDEVVENNPEAYHRYICRNKLIHPVPESPVSFLTTPLFSVRAKMRLLLEPFISAGPKEESVYHFGKRRFGREITEIALDAMISGICTGDIKKLDVNALFPRLKEIELTYRSLLLFLMLFKKKNVKKIGHKKNILFSSFKRGMGVLTETLAKQYQDDIRVSCELQSISKDKENFYLLHNTQGEFFKARRIVFATPAYETSKFLTTLMADLAHMLSAITYVDVATVTLAWDEQHVKHLLDGFGFLVPRNQNLKILGGLFASTLFSQRSLEKEKMVKFYLGGQHDLNILSLSDDEMIHLCEDEGKSLLKLEGLCKFSYVRRLPRAIAQLNMGHQEIRSRIWDIQGKENIYFVGNYIDGISIDSSIKTSKKVAYKIQSEN